MPSKLKPSRTGNQRSTAETAQTKRLFSIVGIVMMVAGIVLIIGSFAMRALPTKAVWTEEQAIAHQKASNRYHNDQFDKKISKTELKTSQEEFEAINAQLDRAKYNKSGLPKLLRWIGIGSAGIGYLVLLLVRSNED